MSPTGHRFQWETLEQSGEITLPRDCELRGTLARLPAPGGIRFLRGGLPISLGVN
jgi:hypothetical protein